MRTSAVSACPSAANALPLEPLVASFPTFAHLSASTLGVNLYSNSLSSSEYRSILRPGAASEQVPHQSRRRVRTGAAKQFPQGFLESSFLMVL